MDQLTEELLSGLPAGQTQHLMKIYGEEPSAPEKPRCQACGAQRDEVLVSCPWDGELMVGFCCFLEPAEPACTNCGSHNFHYETLNAGTCRETGYQDINEVATCQDCGQQHYAEDVLPRGKAA